MRIGPSRRRLRQGRCLAGAARGAGLAWVPVADTAPARLGVEADAVQATVADRAMVQGPVGAVGEGPAPVVVPEWVQASVVDWAMSTPITTGPATTSNVGGA